MKSLHRILLATFATAILAGAAAAVEIGYFANETELHRFVLGATTSQLVVDLEMPIGALTFGPNGALFALQTPSQDLLEIDPDTGSTSTVGNLGLPILQQYDLTVDDSGNLLLVTLDTDPNSTSLLYSIDPTTADVTLIADLLERVPAIAFRNGILWGLSDRLSTIDPVTGQVTAQGPLDPDLAGDLLAMDFDSLGRIWAFTVPPIGPLTVALIRVNAATGLGSFQNGAFEPSTSALAIRGEEADCSSGETTRLLFDGRFAVEIDWTNFQSETRAARVSCLGTDESGFFYFRRPENIELIVKMVDGCDSNGHFWFFAAATTNVGYTIEVTDLESADKRFYENDLGDPSVAVTDTLAFAGCP